MQKKTNISRLCRSVCLKAMIYCNTWQHVVGRVVAGGGWWCSESDEHVVTTQGAAVEVVNRSEHLPPSNTFTHSRIYRYMSATVNTLWIHRHTDSCI